MHNNPPEALSRIGIGTLRFNNKEEAKAIIREAVNRGFNFIETSPYYCYKNSENNAESWIGEVLKDIKRQSRLLVATKSTVGDGALGLGSYIKEKGFGVRNSLQAKEVIHQSLSRLGIQKLFLYFLWAIHTREQLDESLKNGGIIDGLMECRKHWQHIGISSHADPATLLDFLKTGYFDAVMMQYNVVNRTRLRVINYCRKEGIRVFIMNPFGGGFLSFHNRIKELALRFLLLEEGVHILIGFKSKEEVVYARNILESMDQFKISREDIVKEVNSIVKIKELHCTACGYCSPCPQHLNVGACLSYYNFYYYYRQHEIKKEFLKRQWQTDIQLFRCMECGECEKRCSNHLPVLSLIRKAKSAFYT